MMLQQISFVIGSILGSGIFILPYSVKSYGFSGLIGFTIVSVLFISLAQLFSNVSSPFNTIEDALGKNISFFVGWSYWLISWISTIVVLKEIILYVSNIFPFVKLYGFLFESALVIIFSLLNCLGPRNSSKIEFFLSFLKITCLVSIPLMCFYNGQKISIDVKYSNIFRSLPSFVWCFVGVECASIINKNNKKGIITGMIIVAFIYLINLLGIFYLLGYEVSATAYSQALLVLFYNDKLINFVVSFICIGTLNSWIVSSGMCALDCAENNILPIWLKAKNRYGSPYKAILFSSLGLIPISFFLRSQSSFSSINYFLNLSSGVFLLFYTIFCVSYSIKYKSKIASLVALFCGSIFFLSGGVLYSFIIIISGIPLWLWNLNPTQKKQKE